MATNLASINVRFRVGLQELSTQLQTATRTLQRQGEQMQKAGQSLSLYVTAPLVGLGGASVKTYGDLEKLEKGLISVMGSSGKAKAEFEKLKEVAKLPGLGLEEAARGSVNLQAAGFSADEARAALLAFGNALATVGKGARELDLVTLAITQLNNKSSGFGQDLRQLTEQLPQLRGALKAAFGTVDTEKISKSGVTGKQVVEALVKEFEKLPKVTGGINNAFENFSDNVKISMAAVGKSLNESLDIEGLLTSVGESVQGLAEGFAGLDSSTKNVILTYTGFAVATGPVLFGLGKITSAMGTLTLIAQGGQNPFTAFGKSLKTLGLALAVNPLVSLASVFAALAVPLLVANTRFTSLTNATKEFNKVMASGAESIAKESTELYKNLSVAQNEKISKEQRLKAIDNLNAISPEYLGNLTLENINTDAAREATEKYTKSLLEKAKVMAAEEKLVDVQKQLLDIQLGQLDAVKPSLWQNLGNAFRASGNAARFLAYNTQTITENVVEEASELEKLRKKLLEFQQAMDTAGGPLADFAKKFKDLILASGDFKISLDKITKAGTTDWYDERIKALQEMRDGVATTTEAYQKFTEQIEALEKRRDALQGKRQKITSVTEQVGGLKEPEFAKSDRRKTVDNAQAEIEKLEKLQSAYVQADLEWQNFQRQIEGHQLTIDINTDPLKALQATLRNIFPDFDALKNRLESMVVDLAPILEGLAEGFAEGFADVIGSISNGTNAAGAIFGLLLTTLADVAIQIGKAAIGIGIAMESIKMSFASPGLAIASGIALVAIGSLIKSNIPKFADGGIVGGNSMYGDKILARLNSGELVLNMEQQRRMWQQMASPRDRFKIADPVLPDGMEPAPIEIFGTTNITGSDLEIVFNRWNEKKNRFD